MTRAMVPVRRATYAIERRGAGFGAWNILGIVAGVLAALLIAANAKDVARYLKISTM